MKGRFPDPHCNRSFDVYYSDSHYYLFFRSALQRYDHHVVVANLLHNRTRLVTLILKDEAHPVEISMTQQEIEEGKEIEEKIVDSLTERHEAYINQIVA